MWWIEDLGLGCEDLGLGQLRGRLYRRNRGWFSVAVRRYRSIALVLVMRADSGAIPGDGAPGNSPSGICHSISLTFPRSDAAS